MATENGAEIIVEKKANGYEVVLTSTKKNPRGYAQIILTYDLNTKLLTRMQMDEFNGNSILYEMNNLKVKGSVNPEFFLIPKYKK